MRTLKHCEQTNFVSRVAATTAERPIPKSAIRDFLWRIDGAEPNETEVEAAWTFVAGAPQPFPTPDETLPIAMGIAMTEIAPRIEARSWTVRNFKRPGLMTNDCPVHLWRRPSKRPYFGGIGVEDAEEIRFPLSPSSLLVMTPSGCAPTNASLRTLNAELARQSHKFVVATQQEISSLNVLLLSKPPPRIRFRLITGLVDGVEQEIVHMWAG